MADFNRDGLLDLAVMGTQTVVLLNNPGSPGTFEVKPPAPPSSVTAAAVADFNGDGYPDLVATTSDRVEVYYEDPENQGKFRAAPPSLLAFTPHPARRSAL